MIKTLVQHGNSAALIIDKPILELLGVNLETPLKITTDGKSLVISLLPSTNYEAGFEAAMQHINNKHAQVLRKLAE
ncbi:MAG: AbrB/MazE/SpoVT family DNA-binding domain-containing protein [Firmicutes bacterium]|jgi:antitoxin MazE|nr:AbrB/MazE/SpoVT family DNA-binding domain-containing protein [Bacillota bacterium]